MNASASVRASYVRNSIFLAERDTGGLPAQNDPGALAQFRPIDYADWRARNQREKEAEISEDEKRLWKAIKVPEKPVSKMEVIGRMITVFPYQDMIWVVTFTFMIGSLDFVINAFFGLLPLLIPSTNFPTNTTIAVPATILIGGSMFLVAGMLAVPAFVNATRGSFEIEKNEDGSAITEYKPALVNSNDWVWIPAGSVFGALLVESKPFQANILQLLGGMVFTISTVSIIPGLVDPTSAIFPFVSFWPQIIGGSLFWVANTILFLLEQEKWYKIKPTDAIWQGAFMSSIGGFFFMITGVLLLKSMFFESAVTGFIGSWTFFFGSLFQLYVVMKFY